MPKYDVIVAGAGPAGASAAWRAASEGARVLVVDKATFPRDKPCGDGLTPRAVRSLSEIGLGEDLRRFHRVDGLRVFGADRMLEFPWPSSDGFPRFGYVAARTDLDEMVLAHAAKAGAEFAEATAVRGPVVRDGRVCGVRVDKDGHECEIAGDVVVAADGASSVLGRAVGLTRLESRPLGVAVRAHFEASRPEDGFLESYLELRDDGALLPGYGWVFPMGGGRINIGVGLLSTYKEWKSVNTGTLLAAFARMLPAGWRLPDPAELRKQGAVKGWRLPMAFAMGPPWRPGLLAAGDAAGVVNPFNGEGISEAVESGVAAAEVGLEALGSGRPHELSAYDRRLDELWGPYYRLGRTFVRLIGNPRVMRAATVAGMRVPPIMSFAFKVLSNLYRDSGGTAADAIVRGMVRTASIVRVG